MPKFKTVIFDFDGTIADTFQLVVDIVNKNHEEFGIDRIDKSEIPRLKGSPVRALLKGFKIEIVKLPRVFTYIKREMSKQMKDVKMFEGIMEIINELKSRNVTLGIVTTNYVKNVTDVLSDRQEEMFDFIFSSRSLFGKHKVLERVIKEYDVDKASTLYVGDEVRDINAARKVGFKVAAVTWGYNSSELLAKHNPDYLIHSPSGFLDIVLYTVDTLI